MDITEKKIELIEWLARLKDEEVIRKIEILRKETANDIRTPRSMYDIQAKLDRSLEDIEAGRIHAQEAVEAYFNTRFKK